MAEFVRQLAPVLTRSALEPGGRGVARQHLVERQRRGRDFATGLFTPRPVCVTVVVDGTEGGARGTAQGQAVEFRQEITSLLGRRVFLTAVDGPSECAIER